MPDEIRRIVHGSPNWHAAVELRRNVLRRPLGLDFTAEQLAAESHDLHLAAFDGDALIGTAVLTRTADGGFKLRQMAVAESHRGRSVGATLLKTAEAIARDHGAEHIVLAARITACEFYAAQGYRTEGDPFIEVTLPHVTMWKDLQPA